MPILAGLVSRTVPAVANALVRIESPGVALIVRRGGWPGVRIFFDRTDESFEGEHSVEAFDGLFEVREWKRLYVRFPANVGRSPLELELIDCAGLVVTPQVAAPPAMRYSILVRGTDQELTEPVNNIAGLYPRSEEEESNHDAFALPGFAGGTWDGLAQQDQKTFYSPDSYLDGFISGTATFTLAILAQMDRAGTKQCLIGTITPTVANAITGRFEASIATGITPAWSSGRTPGLVAMPVFGVVLQIRTAVANTMNWMFWTRTLG